MAEPLVIARASGGEPLVRNAMGRRRDLVYLANPAYLAEVRRGESNPVGFPCEDVFEYDSATAERLNRLWSEGEVPYSEWEQLRPFRQQVPTV